jgi:hypothetical protein
MSSTCRIVFFALWLIYGATGASDGDGALATPGVRLLPRPDSGLSPYTGTLRRVFKHQGLEPLLRCNRSQVPLRLNLY